MGSKWVAPPQKNKIKKEKTDVETEGMLFILKVIVSVLDRTNTKDNRYIIMPLLATAVEESEEFCFWVDPFSCTQYLSTALREFLQISTSTWIQR